MPGHYRPVWTRRWRIIWLTLVWCAVMATYIIVYGHDNDRLRETALIAIAGLSATVVTGYCGFAAWDDKNYMRTLRKPDPAAPEPCEDKEG
jgi:hypothetical protein